MAKKKLTKKHLKSRTHTKQSYSSVNKSNHKKKSFHMKSILLIAPLVLIIVIIISLFLINKPNSSDYETSDNIKSSDSYMALEIGIFKNCIKEDRHIIASTTYYDGANKQIVVEATSLHGLDKNLFYDSLFNITSCITKMEYPENTVPNIKVSMSSEKDYIECYTPVEEIVNFIADRMSPISWKNSFCK